MAELTSAQQHLLSAQTIDGGQSGTLLRDFNTLLTFIGDATFKVSPANQLLPMGSLAIRCTIGAYRPG